MNRNHLLAGVILVLLWSGIASASIFGDVRGAAVNPQQRAINGAKLGNSNTFGGTHFSEPRQIYVEVRYRFHY